MSKIQPLADRVLVKPMAAEEKTIGGIIIPDSAKEKPLRGEVIAVGEGTKDEKMLLSEGDTVLYGKYAGTELEYEGEKYLIMRQSDILAVLKWDRAKALLDHYIVRPLRWETALKGLRDIRRCIITIIYKYGNKQWSLL